MWSFNPDVHNTRPSAQDPKLTCDLCDGSDNWECPVPEDPEIQEMIFKLNFEGKPLLTTTFK
jgi:hypothetical protein